MHKVECIDCGYDRVRVRSHKRRGSGYCYIDERGFLWDGRRCPECKKIKQFEPDPMTHRKCRRCGVKLPTSRYFNCNICAWKIEPHLHYTQADWGYGCSIGRDRYAASPTKMSEKAFVPGA